MTNVSKKLLEIAKKQKSSQQTKSAKMIKRAHIVTAYKGLQQIKKRLQG